MKKVKLVVSDFHLGLGRYLPDGRVNPVEDFIYDEKFAEFLGHYSTGPYAAADVELIINGDFLNLLLTPTQRPPDVITEANAVETARSILSGHPLVRDALAAFAARRRKSISYIAGNHDQGILWPGVRHVLREDISRTMRIIPRGYAFDGVYIEHGHQNEILHRYDPDRIGVTSLLYPVPIQSLPWGSYFVLELLNPLRQQRPYIYVVKPFRIYMRWAFLNDFQFFWKMLYRLGVFYARNRFHQEPERRRQFQISIENIKEAWLHNSMARHAQNILQGKRYHTVIFGHTHGYLTRGYNGGSYINTGTWNDIVNLDVGSLGRSSKLTYAYIDYRNGTPRAVLKAWRGKYREEEDVLF